MAKMYLYRTPIDMREQHAGLPALMQEAIKADQFSGSMHLFTGKRRDGIRILWWNRNGFVVWLKVIEGRQKFSWPWYVQHDGITWSSGATELMT